MSPRSEFDAARALRAGANNRRRAPIRRARRSLPAVRTAAWLLLVLAAALTADATLADACRGLGSDVPRWCVD